MGALTDLAEHRLDLIRADALDVLGPIDERLAALIAAERDPAELERALAATQMADVILRERKDEVGALLRSESQRRTALRGYAQTMAS
jgi:hypothetical protein